MNVISILTPIIVAAVSLGVTGVLGTVTVGIVKRQIKLYNSIRLVELKSRKIRYWAFLFLIGFCIFYVCSQLIDPEAPERILLGSALGLEEWAYNLTLAMLAVLLVSVLAFIVSLTLSKSAVVDKGIYTESAYLEWYHVHDYIIDEDRGLVILTSHKNTFNTLSGTTPPLRVAINDVEKLKFILNKNKNKFSAAAG